MGASSVTGVGNGAALSQKGPGNGRNYFVPQVNPHVVAAGTVTLAAGTATVTFPVALAEAAANYAVMAIPDETIGTSLFVTKADTNSKFSAFTVAETGGASTADVMWVVVKAGFGLDVARAD